MNRPWRVLAWLLAFVSSLVAAAPLSIEDVWRLPAYIGPTLSDNGQYFAVTMAVKGKMNLAVVDLASMKATVLTGYDDHDVVGVHWVGNERLVFSLGQFNVPEGDLQSVNQGGLFTVSREGKDFRVLAPTLKGLINSGQFVYRHMEYVAPVRGSDDEIFVSTNERSEVSSDVYRLDLRTGRKTLLTFERPERVFGWVIDRKDAARVAVSAVKDENIFVVSYRESESSPWVELYRYTPAGPATVPLYFEEDNQTLIVTSNAGRDTMAVFRYDPKTRTLGEMLAQHPRYDMGADEVGTRLPGVISDPKTRKVVGFAVAGAKPEIAWTDPDYARLQRTIDAALPDTFNFFRRTPDGKRLLVTAYSDRRPERWYMLDEEKRTLEELFASRPWLTPDKLVETKPVFYKTRDGQEQRAYLLLPSNRKAGERLPMVVHIHGGPWGRAETWRFGSFGTREGQLLASRGYAVLLPQFRGTTGFGVKQFASSVKQFGKSMQEDIEDATDWAVKEGYADAGRVCLSGASYGGYATLMGLAKTPDKYRCGVAGLAVTDLELIMTSGYGDIPRSERGLKFWKAMAGDPDKDSAALHDVSPVYLADRIKAPVMIYAGVDDIRVPLEQMKNMRAALAKHGRGVVWIQKDLEAHGYQKLENNVDLYTQMFEFLDLHIGKPGN
ncbi:MAG TPA: alpha/beta fold hydrolase [Caldimonas sp.]